MADWSLLPKDLLLRITKRLDSHFDLLYFRSVCTTWRQTVPLSRPHLCSRVHFPSIDLNRSTIFLEKETFCLFKFPADHSRNSPKFWLVKLKEDKLGKKRFFNPLYSGELMRVKYPLVLDISKIHVQELGRKYVYIEDLRTTTVIEQIAYMNVNPYNDDDYNRFIYLGNHKIGSVNNERRCFLNFYNSGVENLSAVEVEDFGCSVDYIQFERRFYAVDASGNTVCVEPFSKTSFMVAREMENEGISSCYKFLVELCGNLLLVEVKMSGFRYLMDALTTKFSSEVFQLDRERKRWNRVESLGDGVLFVGRYCKFSAPAIPGVEGNCIVFLDKIGEIEQVYVLHLGSGVTLPLNQRLDLLQLFSPPSF